MRYTLKLKIETSLVNAQTLLDHLTVNTYRYENGMLYITSYLLYGHIPSILQSLSNCEDYTILSVSIVKGDK